MQFINKNIALALFLRGKCFYFINIKKGCLGICYGVGMQE